MIHHLFTRPAAPSLFPSGMDAILSERRDADDMADRIIHRTSLPYVMAARQGDWARRLSAKIAQVAK